VYAGKTVTGQSVDPSGGYPDAQLHFWSDGKLAFAPQSFDLKEEARSYVAILLEMLQLARRCAATRLR
jgi:hypothetical protein